MSQVVNCIYLEITVKIRDARVHCSKIFAVGNVDFFTNPNTIYKIRYPPIVCGEPGGCR